MAIRQVYRLCLPNLVQPHERYKYNSTYIYIYRQVLHLPRHAHQLKKPSLRFRMPCSPSLVHPAGQLLLRTPAQMANKRVRIGSVPHIWHNHMNSTQGIYVFLFPVHAQQLEKTFTQNASFSFTGTSGWGAASEDTCPNGKATINGNGYGNQTGISAMSPKFGTNT